MAPKSRRGHRGSLVPFAARDHTMRSLLCLAALLHVATAWNIGLSPSGERLQNRRGGDNLLVVCKVKEYDGAASDTKVEWLRHGQVVSRLGSIMTIPTPYANQLLINRPKPDDGGQYVCRATVDGETQDQIAEISFVDPPEFVDPETEQHPEEGTTAEIVCRVQGSEGFEVFWQFNGSTLDESTPRGYEFRDEKQVLIIPQYNSKKDDGIYNCNAAQFSSFDTLSINVTGYSRPVIAVFDTPDNDRGFEGHSAQLKCGAVGKPKPTYTWYNQDNEEIVDSDKYTVNEGLLIVESLASDDEGTFKCVAKNDIGEDSRTANLTVYLRPKIERMVNLTKKADDEVEIVCRYTGEGDLEAKFVYKDQVFKVGAEENDEEDGDEKAASNEDDNKDENADEDKEEENNEEADENKDGSEEKKEENADEQKDEKEDDENTEASDAPETQNDSQAAEDEDANDEDTDADDAGNDETRRRRSTDDRVSVREEGNSLILTLKDVTLEDAGQYQCVVSNEAGANNRSMTLAITHAPVMKSMSDDLVRSFDGNRVTIFCEVSAVPEPTWTWTRDGDELEADGVNVIIDNTETTSKVTLNNEKGQNYGHYKCKADNGIGNVEEEIHVMQVLQPGEPEGLDCIQLQFPNYGKCSVPEGLYDEATTRPTELQFYVARIEDVTPDFDWETATVVRVDYDPENMRIPNLSPSTQYQVRAKAVNEAGESDIIEAVNMETSEPWAPSDPINVRVECEETCTISWDEPNDHGADILLYRVAVQELTENEETGEHDEAGKEFVFEVKPDVTEVEVATMKPHSIYRISVLAANEIGMGPASKVIIETDDKPTETADALPYTMIAIVGAGLLALLLVIDLICFCTNRCGLIACFCLNCLNRHPSERKEREDHHRVESGRLLDNQA